MASPGINSIVEAEQRPDHRDVCASHYELRPRVVRSSVCPVLVVPLASF